MKGREGSCFPFFLDLSSRASFSSSVFSCSGQPSAHKRFRVDDDTFAKAHEFLAYLTSSDEEEEDTEGGQEEAFEEDDRQVTQNAETVVDEEQGHTSQSKLHSPGLKAEYVSRDSPYCPFANFTQAVVSILFRKHRFTKALYNDLVKICNHKSFQAADMFGSYDTLARSQKDLPLLPYHEIEVCIVSLRLRACLLGWFLNFTSLTFPPSLLMVLCQVPSTSIKRNTEIIYQMDMPSMVRRMMMDPRLDTFCKYPTKEAASSQYIHGAVMREHPLFNLLDPQIANGGLLFFPLPLETHSHQAATTHLPTPILFFFSFFF